MKPLAFPLKTFRSMAIGAFGYPHLKPYQRKRVETFLNPQADALMGREPSSGASLNFRARTRMESNPPQV